MNKALILGITGGFGSHVARAMVQAGWQVKAMLRQPNKLATDLTAVQIITGDAEDGVAVAKAAKDVDVIVYGINVPYHQWDAKAQPLLENAGTAAEEYRLSIVFPGNVYVFDPDQAKVFSEQSAQRPVNGKGRIRHSMEQRLQRSSQQGAKVLIVRAGDYIGAGAPSTWMGQLVKKTRQGFTLSAAGPEDVIHSWAYLPDVANTVVALLQRTQSRPAFDVYHFQGYQVSFRDIARVMRTVTGKSVKLTQFPWFIVQLLSPFSGLFKSLIEMRYLWEKEVNLDQAKLKQTLAGAVPATPLAQALVQSGLLT